MNDIIPLMIQSIRNATPLPKGHGRLVDANAIINKEDGCYWETEEELRSAPTVVEADDKSL